MTVLFAIILAYLLCLSIASIYRQHHATKVEESNHLTAPAHRQSQEGEDVEVKKKWGIKVYTKAGFGE